MSGDYTCMRRITVDDELNGEDSGYLILEQNFVKVMIISKSLLMDALLEVYLRDAPSLLINVSQLSQGKINRLLQMRNPSDNYNF